MADPAQFGGPRTLVVWLALCGTLLVLLFLTGCGSTREIQIENVSDLDFTNVRVANVAFGDIRAGTVSPYKKVNLTLRYAAIRMDVAGVDVTGQTLNFGSRRFTYRIGVKDLAAGQLDIQLLPDASER